jgi:ArsR family transcriptional regulator
MRICFRVKKPKPAEPAELFKILSDSTRLRLLNLLARGEVCVCDLHGTLGVDQPKVSRHLARMKRAGLVDARRNGKWMHYQLARHADPLVRHVLEGLRAWMGKETRMNSERRRLGEVCCRNDKAKGRGRKKTS